MFLFYSKSNIPVIPVYISQDNLKLTSSQYLSKIRLEEKILCKEELYLPVPQIYRDPFLNVVNKKKNVLSLYRIFLLV